MSLTSIADQERLSRLLSVDLETPRGDSTLVDPTLTWIERAGTEKQKKKSRYRARAQRPSEKKPERRREKREKVKVFQERERRDREGKRGRSFFSASFFAFLSQPKSRIR